MAGNKKIETELAEIKALLKKAQKRADIQGLNSLGIALMFGSLALLAMKAPYWQVWLVFFVGVVLTIGAPYIANIGKK